MVLPAVAIGAPGDDVSGASVAFGGRNDSLYLRFEVPSSRTVDVLSAFLLLDAFDAPPAGAEDVPVVVFPIAETWSHATVRTGRRPRLSRARADGIVRPMPGTPIRIDVTEPARWALRDPHAAGLVMVAAAPPRKDVLLSTGLDTARAPRLEIYFRETPAQATR
jgi:hypothetical protein